MKFTISDCINRINQALNYPAVTYEDVSHFFDHAIAELNSTLRIALPTFTEMRLENTFRVSDSPDTIVLKTAPNVSKPIASVNVVPTQAPEDYVDVKYYIGGSSKLDHAFYLWKDGSWNKVSKVYGVTNAGKAYTLLAVDASYAIWYEIPMESVSEFDITNYLSSDWILLFIIPYVCFKFAVRNGDTGSLFSDEFTQGFQQLQTSYNIPNTVTLSTVAHLPAYKTIAAENINNLRQEVPTRAIYQSMMVRNGVQTVHGAGLFDIGGWGI